MNLLLVAFVALLAAGVFIQSARLAVFRDRYFEAGESVAEIRRRLHAFWDDQMEDIGDDEGEWGPLAICAMHDIALLIVESPWGDGLDDVYGELDYDLPFETDEDDEEDADDL